MSKIIFALLLIFVSSPVATDEVKQLDLSTLNSDCKIEQRWMGRIFVLPYGAWLVCGEMPFLITEPNNLLRHVSIQSPQQALEYVRFFSSRKTYFLFNLGGMVELLPEGKDPTSEFFEVKEHELKIKPVEVTELPVSFSQSEQGVGRKFLIVRTVVQLDRTVLRISEQVSEDGFYDIVSKEVILTDSSKIGIYHLGLT